jgi:hypothetical protein
MIKTFLMRLPEFNDELDDGGEKAIEQTIKASQRELNAFLWKELYEEGVIYLTADKLIRSRLGERLRDQDDPAAQSVYAIEFERLRRIVSMGAVVL